jgi:hypothetical protein
LARHRQRGDRDTREDHDKDDRHRKPRRRKPKGRKPKGGATARIKEQTSQVVTGKAPMAAAPGQRPPDYPNDAAVYTTGPGQAVEYHYHREGTYADEYAQQADLQQFQTRERAPNIGGPGEIVTSGAANNPT